MDDEIWIYYVDSNVGFRGRVNTEVENSRERHAISRAIMKLNGFVSAYVPYGDGGEEIITKPLKF